MNYRIYIALLGAAAAIGQTTAGSVSGSVVDAKTGEPLRSVPLMAVREGTPPMMRTARTDGEGGFAIGGLASGGYRICVQAGAAGYVDPCEWNAAPTTVAVGTGPAKAALRIALDKAAVVSVDVADVQGLLTDVAAANARGRDVTVGVWDKQGLYHPARRQAAGPGGPGVMGGLRFGMAVPNDVNVTLAVASRGLRLGDGNGAALAGNAIQQAFQHASSDANPQLFKFIVLSALP